MKELTVIIPTYNRPDLLYLALESLYNQKYRDFNIIIINDGGMSVSDLISKWRNKLAIELFELKDNIGVTAARNVGIQNTNSKFISFLDDDDIYLPNFLSDAIDLLTNKNYDAVYFKTLVSPTRVNSYKKQKENPIYFDYEFNSRFMLIANFIPPVSIVCKNSIDSRFRFDASLSACEDWDMWLNLLYNFNYKFYYCPEVSAIYHRIPGSNSMTTLNIYDVFSVPYKQIIQKWKTGDKLINEYRKYISIFHRVFNEQYQAGNMKNSFCYEHLLKQLLINFNKEIEITNIEELITNIVLS